MTINTNKISMIQTKEFKRSTKKFRLKKQTFIIDNQFIIIYIL